MPVSRPFYRCVRPGLDGSYSEGGRWMYLLHPDYAPDALHYLRAFYLLQRDLERLFEYVEPADVNGTAYSYRCLELLIRACGEVEANCRSILSANAFNGPERLTMDHYRKLNSTHRLSSYRVRVPVWAGNNAVRQPFAAWNSSPRLTWFQAHHGGKHNRQAEFPSASLDNVVDAVAAVVILLSAQFMTHDFRPVSLALSLGDGPKDGFEHAIGGYFEVKFPDDWPIDERYDFDWQSLRAEANPFQELPL